MAILKAEDCLAKKRQHKKQKEGEKEAGRRKRENAGLTEITGTLGRGNSPIMGKSHASGVWWENVLAWEKIYVCVLQNYKLRSKSSSESLMTSLSLLCFFLGEFTKTGCISKSES